MATHITYVITDLAIGGVPLHLLRLATAARAAGFHVRVISLAPAGPVAERLTAGGVAVDSCAAGGARDLAALLRLRRLLAAVHPDVIHAMLFHANLAVRLVGPGAGVPPERIICEIQTVEIERPWHLRLDRWTLHRCAFEIGNSPSVIAHLRDRGRLPPERLRLVHGGIDAERFGAAQPVDRATLGVRQDSRMLFWSGRLDPIKGLADLLRAMPAIARDHDVELVLAGDGPERDALQQLVGRLGVADRVHFLGIRHDIPALLGATDLFVFPSHTEGLPNALLEAMAAGRPIVCTDVPGNRDLIADGCNGRTVAPQDPAALAAAVAELLSDPPRADRLGDAARARAADFDQGRTVADYLALYDEVLRGR